MAVMEFANVSFRYPTSKEQVLKEVSFQVQKGEFAGHPAAVRRPC